MVFFGHHDNWLGTPDGGTRDTTAARDAIASAAPGAGVIEPGYLSGIVVFT
jgi:hypothetical protein